MFVVWTLYRFQSSFKISYCAFCFLSLFPYLTQLLSPCCLAPGSRSFLYLCLLSYPLIFHLLFHGVHFFSFLTARQSRHFLKLTSLFCSIYFIFKVASSSDLGALCSPHLRTQRLLSATCSDVSFLP